MFDLQTREVVFRRELDPNHLIGPVDVLAGRSGHLGFSYLDGTAGERVLLHVRLAPQTVEGLPQPTGRPCPEQGTAVRPTLIRESPDMTLAQIVLTALLATEAEPRQPPPRVEQMSLSRHQRSWGDGAELHVDLPYFDADDHLRWDSSLVGAAGSCAADSFDHELGPNARCERRTVLRTPRVDTCRCVPPELVVTRSAVVYIGLDEALRERWRRRPATFRSTPRALAGAHATGLVFADGEVWSPATGATVRAATRDRGHSRSCWLPDRDAFLEVDADVTLVRTRGGIYLRSRDGERALVLPVARRLIGRWVVDDFDPIPGTSLVLLGERLELRGHPGPVRFSVFDLSNRKILFRRELDPHHLIGPVRVIAGRNGHMGFSYLDENAGEWVLQHFRLVQ